MVFKQEGLDERIQYDAYPRKSLVDHFFDPQTPLAAVARGEAPERGDFHLRPYEAACAAIPSGCRCSSPARAWPATCR